MATQVRTRRFCQEGLGISAEGGLDSREQSEIFGAGFENVRRMSMYTSGEVTAPSYIRTEILEFD